LIILKPEVTLSVCNLVKKNSGKLSLDAGCGQGDYLFFFNGAVIGLDLELDILKKLKKQIGNLNDLSLIQADLRYLPFKNKIFDFILCSEAIEHIDEKDACKLVDDFERITKNKGIIQIDTPNTNFLQELVRRMLHIGWVSRQKDAEVHDRHHSFYTCSKLRKMGLKVNGCLSHWGGVLFPKSVVYMYDILTWHVPELAGTLIGVKLVSSDESAEASSIELAKAKSD
jgi:ubiquinone/menaquinone biosynthesis C-methylase UbiE